MKDDTQKRLEEIHKSALASIVEMVEPLEYGGSDDAQDEAREAILNDALSVEVRSDWEAIGANLKASQFRICITTGGPAVQIVGDLNQWGEPENAVLQVQDWFTPWTEFPTSTDEDIAIMTYAQQFYFGE